VIGAALTVLSAPLSAQDVQEHALAGPEATFPEGFSRLSGMRELADGRVMVADGLGQVLVIADLASGAADTIGAEGQGPDEYREPDGLFVLPGDSTLLVDLGNGRLTAIAPDGSFGSCSRGPRTAAAGSTSSRWAVWAQHADCPTRRRSCALTGGRAPTTHWRS
jgi:hypothetical protein